MEDELEINEIFIDEVQEEIAETFNRLVIESRKTDKRNLIERQILVATTKNQFLKYFIKVLPYFDKDFIPCFDDFLDLLKQFNHKSYKQFITELSLKYEIKKQITLNE